jgi:hypothetical protein
VRQFTKVRDKFLKRWWKQMEFSNDSGLSIEELDLFNSIISIEDVNGNTKMEFEITKDGQITKMNNCDVADLDNSYGKTKIRVQQIEYDM